MTNQHKTKTKHNKARKSDQTSLGRIFYLAFLSVLNIYESIKMDMRRLQVDYQFLGRQI